MLNLEKITQTSRVPSKLTKRHNNSVNRVTKKLNKLKQHYGNSQMMSNMLSMKSAEISQERGSIKEKEKEEDIRQRAETNQTLMRIR